MQFIKKTYKSTNQALNNYEKFIDLFVLVWFGLDRWNNSHASEMSLGIYFQFEKEYFFYGNEKC